MALCHAFAPSCFRLGDRPQNLPRPEKQEGFGVPSNTKNPAAAG
ncbi:hypothetical protein JL2886_03976 [Phaeobacter gallaeciensis]|uniref:Uncharacterized protein n=1 Tax=Phaeobacter gallaeciensis TaxID=60890 RepID=A0A1B0ZXK6_9RHOB|nr:hypothetical protein JL2886_03976 [Phaeobacter gallaeciensis]